MGITRKAKPTCLVKLGSGDRIIPVHDPKLIQSIDAAPGYFAQIANAGWQAMGYSDLTQYTKEQLVQVQLLDQNEGTGESKSWKNGKIFRPAQDTCEVKTESGDTYHIFNTAHIRRKPEHVPVDPG